MMLIAREVDGHVYVEDSEVGVRWCEVLGEPGVDRLKRGRFVAEAIRVTLLIETVLGRIDLTAIKGKTA